jgi:glycerophosphocholine phosphodiesterase GPCPD1
LNTHKTIVFYSEKVAITGSCDELGNWDPSHCVFLEPSLDRTWTTQVDLPCDANINFRYFIASVDPSANPFCCHVRKFESHLKPRSVLAKQDDINDFDTFGFVDGQEKIDKGWLTNETILNFKFFNDPFALKERIKNRLLYVKITPMNLRINSESSSMQSIEESLSNDTLNNPNEQPAYAFTEVATLNENDNQYLFSKQDQFGRLYKTDDILIFHITVAEPENIAYLIDLYSHDSKSILDKDIPIHFGYHYLLPNVLKKSEGILELPITCATKHRPLGMMKIEFVKITPLNNPTCDLKVKNFYFLH